VLDFESGIELRAHGRTKAHAVATLLQESNRDIPAAYLGDDLTDEDAFAALAGHGLSVLVRSQKRETAAQAWLRPPEELLAFLQRWARVGDSTRKLGSAGYHR
ncbi:MAG: trehalose-phosphatase, partial [Betaproteobacteria bacterium]